MRPATGLLTYLMTAVTFFLTTADAGAQSSTQTIPELVRQKASDPIVRGTRSDLFPVTLEQLTTDADLVLDATLIKGEPYLTTDEQHIITDYTIDPKRIFRELGSPRSSPPMLAVYGGEMTIEGSVVRAVDYTIPAPHSGRRYLLFLKQIPDEGIRRIGREGRYAIYRGGAFEIAGQHLEPLASYPADKLLFKDVAQLPFDEAAARILSIVAATKK